MFFNIIVAADLSNGIGKNGDIPWHFSDDFKYFKKCTSDSIVVMGRKTWDSLPKKPLPNRQNVVVSKRFGILENTTVISNFDLNLLENKNKDIWIIGGESLYKQAIVSPNCKSIHLSRIHDSFDCDTFFPIIPSNFNLLSNKESNQINKKTGKDTKVEYLVYNKVN